MPQLTIRNSGRLLFFDPTSELTAFGTIPAGRAEQLCTRRHGQWWPNDQNAAAAAVPESPAARGASATDAGRRLLGEVEETRDGYEAATMRSELMKADRDKRVKLLEGLLNEFLDRSRLTYASIGNLDKVDEPLILKYKFEAARLCEVRGRLDAVASASARQRSLLPSPKIRSESIRSAINPLRSRAT